MQLGKIPGEKVTSFSEHNANHGKSIFLINLVNTIIEQNQHDFVQGDAIMFLTLEDKNNCPY